MSCEGCTAAASNPRSGLYLSGCMSCSARAVAGQREFFESTRAEEITPAYKRRLQAVFGATWKEGHEAVKQWATHMKGQP